MAPPNRALATFHAVNRNHVAICSSLTTIFNKMFEAISGCILETVRDKTKVTVNR